MKLLSLGTMAVGMTMAVGCLGPGMSHRPAVATTPISETTVTSAALPAQPGLYLDRTDPWGDAPPQERRAIDTSDPWAEPTPAPVAAAK